ncbi:biotin/lipoyl-containing protein [Moorella sulfitireducens]|uniref:biotin/lipoyl-containing protein n=1 Tax=Neomoorella sulfitireducens TaxID=2972948 RepID=UPI0021AC8AB8|nr:biotin/lipoyl-containing protein [Moorella sulfitireducens]
MKRFRVKVESQVFEVEVEEIKENLAGQVKAEPNLVQAVAPSMDGSPKPAVVPPHPVPSGNGAPGNVNAPMPGSILSVKVKEGERVSAGQLLLLLEAMKMENEIVAPRDGVVKRIYIAAGQSVNTGEPLVALE